MALDSHELFFTLAKRAGDCLEWEAVSQQFLAQMRSLPEREDGASLWAWVLLGTSKRPFGTGGKNWRTFEIFDVFGYSCAAIDTLLGIPDFANKPLAAQLKRLADRFDEASKQFPCTTLVMRWSERGGRAPARLPSVPFGDPHWFGFSIGKGGTWSYGIADHNDEPDLAGPGQAGDVDPVADSGDGEPIKRKRRRKADQHPRPLTAKQTEAVQIVGECKGNFAEAARRLGRDPKTVREHYEAGIRKLGRKAVKHATQRLPKDRRGQSNVTSDDDQRG